MAVCAALFGLVVGDHVADVLSARRAPHLQGDGSNFIIPPLSPLVTNQVAPTLQMTLLTVG